MASPLYVRLTNGIVMKYQGTPHQWEAIGANVAGLSAGNNNLYVWLTNGVAMRYLGSPGRWEVIGSNVAGLVAGGGNLFAWLNNGVAMKYLGTPDQWQVIGANVVGAIVDGGSLFVRLTNRVAMKYLGSPDKWQEIGANVTGLTAAGGNLYAWLNDRVAMKYLGSPGLWQTIGANVAGLTADGGNLYAWLTDRVAMKYLGTPGVWQALGANVLGLAAGGGQLYAWLTDRVAMRYMGSPDQWEAIGANVEEAAFEDVSPSPPSGALFGYAIGLQEDGGASASFPSRPGTDFDHTYVRSNDGDAWGCYGRKDGGQVIISGGGDHRLKMAKCLAKPNGTAGIVFGVTGTCQQCCNRILSPAGCTVHSARGYAGSVALFGTYGSDYPVWQANVKQCQIQTGSVDSFPPIPIPPFPPLPPLPPIPPIPRPPFLGLAEARVEGLVAENLKTGAVADLDRDYSVRLSDLYATHPQDRRSTLAADLEAIVQYKTDNRVGVVDMINLKNLQVGLHEEHAKLVAALQSNEITMTNFVLQTNLLLEKTFQELEAVIGEDRFVLTFDSPPNRASKILSVPSIGNTQLVS